MDLSRALDDIKAMRTQMARATEFRGYGPLTFGLTGLLALAGSVVQWRFIPIPEREIIAYLWLWSGIAVVAVTMIGVEVVMRSRRVHAGLATEMVEVAAEELLPSIVTGALLTLVVWRYTPESVWMLPGLWQILLSLGVFGSCRTLPAPLKAVGIWYLCTGLACLVFARQNYALSPWAMGVPFGLGEFLAAGLIAITGGRDEEIEQS